MLRIAVPRFKPSLSWKTIGAVGLKTFFTHLQKHSEDNLFEADFSRYIGTRHVVLVPSGRAALYAILKHSGLQAGDEVILPAFTYWAIPAVVRALGLRPIFVDIDPLTCNLDAHLILKKITNKTRAIVPTHLYGLACDMECVLKIAEKYGLFVIEDCVQALGATYRDRKVGSLGDASYFSFGLTKTMPLLGGGVVASNCEELISGVKEEMTASGFLSRWYIFKRIGLAAVMKAATTPLVFDMFLYPLIYGAAFCGRDIIDSVFEERHSVNQPVFLGDCGRFPPFLFETFGRRALVELEAMIWKRKNNGRYLQTHIYDSHITMPPVAEGNVFTSFPIRLRNRDRIQRKLVSQGIDASRGFMEAFSDDCPNAKLLQQQILHLPVYPGLKEAELSYICDYVNAILKGDRCQ